MTVTSDLEGELVRLRAREEPDLGLLNERFCNPSVLAGIGSLVFPESMEGIRAWFSRSRTSPDEAAFTVETTDRREPVGVCGLEKIAGRARSAILGTWIGEPFWGRGYGTEATRLVCRFGFRQMNLHRVGLTVIADNAKAVRAYEKAGFRREAVLRDAHFVGGRHVDLVSMGLLADDPPAADDDSGA